MSGFLTTSAEDLIVHTLAMIAGGRLIFDKAIFPCTPRAWIACDEAYDEVRSRERAGLTPKQAFAGFSPIRSKLLVHHEGIHEA